MRVCFNCGGNVDGYICKRCGVDFSKSKITIINAQDGNEKDVNYDEAVKFISELIDKSEQLLRKECFSNPKKCEQCDDFECLCRCCPALGLFECEPKTCGIYKTIFYVQGCEKCKREQTLIETFAKYYPSSFGIKNYFTRKPDGKIVYRAKQFEYPEDENIEIMVYKDPRICDDSCENCLTEKCICRECSGLGECTGTTPELCLEERMKTNLVARNEYLYIPYKELEAIREYIGRNWKGDFYKYYPNSDKPDWTKNFDKDLMDFYKKVTDINRKNITNPNNKADKPSDFRDDFRKQEKEVSSMYPGYAEEKEKPLSNIARWVRANPLFKSIKGLLNGELTEPDVYAATKLGTMTDAGKNQKLWAAIVVNDGEPVTSMKVMLLLNSVGEKPKFKVIDTEANVTLEATLDKYFASENKDEIELVRYSEKEMERYNSELYKKFKENMFHTRGMSIPEIIQLFRIAGEIANEKDVEKTVKEAMARKAEMTEEKKDQILRIAIVENDGKLVTSKRVIDLLNEIGYYPRFEAFDLRSNVDLDLTIIKYFGKENLDTIEMVRHK